MFWERRFEQDWWVFAVLAWPLKRSNPLPLTICNPLPAEQKTASGKERFRSMPYGFMGCSWVAVEQCFWRQFKDFNAIVVEVTIAMANTKTIKTLITMKGLMPAKNQRDPFQGSSSSTVQCVFNPRLLDATRYCPFQRSWRLMVLLLRPSHFAWRYCCYSSGASTLQLCVYV